MKQHPLFSNWMSEYQEFLNTKEITPPSSLSEQVLSTIHSNFNPSLWFVFLKLLAVHAIIGTITLIFCPQFGISPISNTRYANLGIPNIGMAHILMHYGETACMLGCGAIFLGGSALAASMILRPEEIRVIRKTQILQLPLLAFLSLSLFNFIGIEVAMYYGLFWLLGSILGGITTFEFGWALRNRFKSRVIS
jgi:hypothetical protein